MRFLIAFLSLSGASVVAAADLAIIDVTVIDGTGGPNVPNQTVLIEDGRIAAVQAATASIPSDAQTIEASGWNACLPANEMIGVVRIVPASFSGT